MIKQVPAVNTLAAAMATAASVFFGGAAQAADPLGDTDTSGGYSVTEIQFLLGQLKNPFDDGKESLTSTITIQHASSWSFGDVYGFVDITDDGRRDGFNDMDAYGEFYAYFSSSKLLGAKYGDFLMDLGVVVGVNAGVDSDFVAYLPGIYADFKMPGFAFFRLQLTGFLDDSPENGASGSARDGWQTALIWAAPFEIGGQLFSFEGFIEYTGLSFNDTYGTKQHDWILAQPQLRWDAGYAFTGVKNKFFLGTEYQYWRNKLGTDVDESSFQALAVVRF